MSAASVRVSCRRDPAPDCANTTPAIAFLGLLADLLDGGNRAGAISRPKPLLLGPKLPTAAGVNYPRDAGLPRLAIARRAPCPPQGASGRDQRPGTGRRPRPLPRLARRGPDRPGCALAGVCR
jgi:hypothetical protein